MTSPAAAAAIFVLFDSTAFSAIVITFTFEITLMTGGTEGRVSGRGVGKRKAYARAMAAATPWVPSMVAGVVASRVMTEDAWCPAVC